MKEEQEGQGFVFKDRRKISLDETQEEPGPATSAGEASSSEEAPRESQSASGEPAQKTDSGSQRSALLPEVNLSTFVFSLSSSALVHLGEIPEPVSNRMQQDLGLAKQIIDTLGMIDDKTRGNLDADEERLLKGVLYDLRMRFVQKSQ